MRKATFLLILSIFLLTLGVGHAQRVRMATASQEAVNTTTLKMIEYLAEQGIEVEMVEHSGGSKSTQAVIARQVDFAMAGSDEIMIAASKGAPVRAFSPSSQPKINYVVVARSGINTLEDLVGKNFGISGPSGFDNILTRIALQQNGIDPSALNITQIGGSSARAQALAANRVDAVTVFLPNWIDLKAQGNYNMVVSLANEFPTLTQSFYVARPAWIRENREVATAIIDAQLRAQEWAYHNKEEWVDMAMDFLRGRDREVVEATYDELKAMGMFAMDGGVGRSGALRLMELLIESGDLEEPVALEAWMDLDLLEPILLD